MLPKRLQGWRNITEDSNLHSHRHDELSSEITSNVQDKVCIILWVLTPHSLVEVYQRFGGTYFCIFRPKTLCKQHIFLRLLGLLFDTGDGGGTFARNVDKYLLDYTKSHPETYSTLHSHRRVDLKSNKPISR